MPKAVLLLVLLVCAVAVAKRVSYAGHRVVDVKLQTTEELAWLASLPEETDGVRGVDVWSNDGALALGLNTVRLTPAGFSALAASSLEFTIRVDDLEARDKLIDSQPTPPLPSSDVTIYDPADPWFVGKWHTYDEIYNKLKEFSGNHSNIMTFLPEIGKSHEGRSIGGVRIMGKNPVRRVLFISGTHAREWIAESTSLFAMAVLAEQYGKDQTITSLVDSLEIYVVPCYNPDGYTYSHTTNRYWRKNRRVNGDGTYGVDQNRNWEPNWSGTGASKSTSSDTYCGPAALSEPEVSAMHKWIGSFHDGIAGLIDFHSNAALFLRPWAYQTAKSPDETLLKQIGDTFATKIKEVHGTKYQSIRSAELYVASGTAGDAAYQLGIKRSFVIELAGSDFVVPVTDIKKQGEEVFNALLYFLDACRS